MIKLKLMAELTGVLKIVPIFFEKHGFLIHTDYRKREVPND